MIPAPTVEALSAHPDGDRWELRSHLELPAVTSAVPCARHHARRVLADWHLDDRADVTELVVAELVTNAVRACPGETRGVPCVRLWLCADLRARVLVQVFDASDTMPELHEPGRMRPAAGAWSWWTRSATDGGPTARLPCRANACGPRSGPLICPPGNPAERTTQ